jgi:hypothetical protein
MPQSHLNTAQKQRMLFSRRLISSLEILDVKASPTILQREYNIRSNQPPITSHAARKWLMGEAIPTQDRLQVLADWLNVSPSWLRFGEDDINGKKNTRYMTAQEWRLVQGFRRLTEKQRAGLLALVLAIPAAGSKKSTRDA